MIKTIYKNLFSEKLRNNIRLFLMRLAYPYYLGNKYHCNCCDKNFRKFRAKGNIKRENAMCPYCLSLERTRVLDFYLENEIKLYKKENIKLLHIAPERSLYRKIAKLNIEYIDGDLHPAYANHQIDLTNIPYSEQYFDLIICSHVLGHIPNEAKALQEIKRVLKPKGIALIMTLINPKARTLEKGEHLTPKERLKYYTESNLCRLHGYDFQERIEAQGLAVEAIDYRLNFNHNFQLKHNLGDGNREMIFHCTHSDNSN